METNKQSTVYILAYHFHIEMVTTKNYFVGTYVYVITLCRLKVTNIHFR